MITIQEFRNDPERVAKLRRALENPALREAMEILSRKGPGVIRSDITETFASIRLGHVAGWSEYAETLEGMATHPQDSDIENPRLIEAEVEQEEE